MTFELLTGHYNHYSIKIYDSQKTIKYKVQKLQKYIFCQIFGIFLRIFQSGASVCTSIIGILER